MIRVNLTFIYIRILIDLFGTCFLSTFASTITKHNNRLIIKKVFV